mgnify:CR=1 FL=1
MKKKWLAALFLTSSIALAACGGDESASDSGKETDVDPMEQVAKQRCGSCHGGNLEGNGGMPSLKGLSAKYSEEEILDIINNGIEGTAMRGGFVAGEEAEKMAAYLHGLQ